MLVPASIGSVFAAPFMSSEVLPYPGHRGSKQPIFACGAGHDQAK